MLATYLAFVARHSRGIRGCLCLLTDINGRAFLRVTGVCVSNRVRVPGWISASRVGYATRNELRMETVCVLCTGIVRKYL